MASSVEEFERRGDGMEGQPTNGIAIGKFGGLVSARCLVSLNADEQLALSNEAEQLVLSNEAEQLRLSKEVEQLAFSNDDEQLVPSNVGTGNGVATGMAVVVKLMSFASQSS